MIAVPHIAVEGKDTYTSRLLLQLLCFGRAHDFQPALLDPTVLHFRKLLIFMRSSAQPTRNLWKRKQKIIHSLPPKVSYKTSGLEFCCSHVTDSCCTWYFSPGERIPKCGQPKNPCFADLAVFQNPWFCAFVNSQKLVEKTTLGRQATWQF